MAWSDTKIDLIVGGIVFAHMLVLFGIRLYFGHLEKKDQQQLEETRRENQPDKDSIS